jgi:hypothetical protein
MRDGSRHVEDGPKPAQDRNDRRSAAYGKYKSELNRLFDSGGVAEKFKDELDDGSEDSAKAKKTKALRKAEGDEFFALLGEYLAAWGMPENTEVLVKATTSGDLAIVKKAVAALAAKAAGERVPGRAAMLERLRTLVMTAGDPELAGLVDDLRRALGT